MALNLRRESLSLWALLIVFLLFLGFFSNAILLSNTNIVFNVHKRSSTTTSLAALKTHGYRRHGRLLSSSAIVDLPLEGNGDPSGTALYYTKIGIGTPPVDYNVQVDTGSNILWVNCAGCDQCPTKSDLGINLRHYDPKDSTTASLITCDQDFCKETVNYAGCKKVNSACTYGIKYGDGSSSGGYFVRDNIQLDRINGTVAFGCGDDQSGQLSLSAQAVDGILGFGQANSSLISQLATAGIVKKRFSHCLDGNNGGGIFAIGQVVHPKMISTPIIPNRTHYNLNLKGIEVGRVALQFSSDIAATDYGKAVIIDSGTTLAYLEDDLYNPIFKEIMAAQPSLRLLNEQQFTCFQFSDNVDDGFPTVTFRFENSLSLVVYPHDYLFPFNIEILQKDKWCIGWQKGGLLTNNDDELSLLGDLVLSNKLVLYDLEDMTIGWTEHDCSSSNKVKDEKSGAESSVGTYKNISSESPVGYKDRSSSSATGLRILWGCILKSILAIVYLANYVYLGASSL